MEAWAREAYTIVVDVDKEELKKPTLHIDLPICADEDVIDALNDRLGDGQLEPKKKWIDTCTDWRIKYPVVQPKDIITIRGIRRICLYQGDAHRSAAGLCDGSGNGSACVCGSHAWMRSGRGSGLS